MASGFDISELSDTLASAVDLVAEDVAGADVAETVQATLDHVHKLLGDEEFVGVFAKFAENPEEAHEKIKDLLSCRQKHSWYENLDPADPKIQEIFDQGWFLLLPERVDNKQLYWHRLGLDLNGLDNKNWQRAAAVFCDYNFLIDHKDKTGTIAVYDMAGVTVESFTSLISIDEVKDWLLILAEHPMDMTNIHWINCSDEVRTTFVEAIEQGFSGGNSAFNLNAYTLEELYKQIPLHCLPAEYLPADYTGPNAGSIQELIEFTKAKLTDPEVRERIIHISNEKWKKDDGSEAPAASD